MTVGEGGRERRVTAHRWEEDGPRDLREQSQGYRWRVWRYSSSVWIVTLFTVITFVSGLSLPTLTGLKVSLWKLNHNLKTVSEHVLCMSRLMVLYIMFLFEKTWYRQDLLFLSFLSVFREQIPRTIFLPSN